MNSILITGCNRGIGLGLVKSLVSHPLAPRHIFATCRDLEKATELKDIAAANKNVHLFQIDLSNFEEYGKIVEEIESITQGNGLNCLFNNAGFSPRSVRLKQTKAEDVLEAFKVNTLIPIMFSQACLPLIEKAANANDGPMSVKRAAIINMSSILGSIQSNTTGGMYGYKTSKAALNMATRSMSVDLLPSKILCVVLHPGWVRTDMGGSKAPLDVDTASPKIIDTILSFDEKHNGGFYQYDGKELPF